MNPARWCLEKRLVVLYLVALLAAAGSDQTLNDYLQRDDRISAP